MAARKTQNAVSLFPFLAVLVCTMGALILLLLVTTRRIRNEHTQTVAQSELSDFEDHTGLTVSDWNPDWPGEETEDLMPQPNHPLDTSASQPEPSLTTETSISLLPPNSQETVRPDTAEEVERKRAEIKRLQDHLADESKAHADLTDAISTARLQLQSSEFGSQDYERQLKELTELRQREADLVASNDRHELLLQQLQAELDSSSRVTEDGEQLLRSRESALLRLREIADQKQQAVVAGTDQTVIDFTNSTGTQRSPVVVNVTESGFEFLPSGVRITVDDMKGFPANDNPLLAGVLALHESRHPNSLSVKPYVLLLVRPDGSMLFYAAQRTLTDAGIHFGYELVEQSQQIAAGTGSGDETQALRQALLSALNRRHELYSGLLSQVDALRRSSKTETPRRVRMLPNGGIAYEEDRGTQLEGRFYAGGHAPPPKNNGKYEPWPAPVPTPADQSDFSRNRGGYNGPAINNPLPSQPSADDEHADEAEDTSFPPLIPRSDQSEPVVAEMQHDQANNPALPANAMQSANSQASGNSITAAPSDELAEVIPGVSPSAAPQRESLFPRVHGLSGNLGVGADSQPTETATLSPYHPDFVNSPWSASAESAPSTTTEAEASQGNRTSSEPSGWPIQGTAAPNPATRTAGTAPNLSPDFAEASAIGPTVGGADAVGGGTANGGGVAASSDRESFMRKFLQEVERQKEANQPDPFLLALLRRAKMRREKLVPGSEEQQAETPNNPASRDDVSTPPATDNGAASGRVPTNAPQLNQTPNAAPQPLPQMEPADPIEPRRRPRFLRGLSI